MFRVLVALSGLLCGFGVPVASWPMPYKSSQRALAALPSRVLLGAGDARLKFARKSAGEPDQATAPGPCLAPVSSFQVRTLTLSAHVT
jgi:hypothetical protein